MTQTQFLLLLIVVMPFFNCLLIKVCATRPRLSNAISKLMPILFCIILLGIKNNLGRDDSSYFLLNRAGQMFALGFAVDQFALIFLAILNFFWLIFAFYNQRFLQLFEAKNLYNLKYFFVLIIAFVNLIILSKNLLTILLFYNCLIILCHFFALRFFHNTESKFSHFFTFLLYLESIFLFLAIVATYKIVGRIDFVEGGIIPEKLSSDKYALLLILYCGGLFTSLLLPFYLFYRSINIEPIIVYVLFFLAYGLSSLYIFIKLLAFVFGFSGFATVILQLGYGDFFNCVEWIFLVNITVASVFLVFSKSLKSSFFYLFFQQFLCTLFAIFIFAVFDESLILLTLLSFLLSFSLVFLSISNCILYLKKSQQKWLSGLFYNLKISVILFVFAIGNLMGIIPGIGAVEKFFLIKIIMQKELWLTAIVFGINFFSLIIFSWKIFYPIFFQLDESEVKSNLGDEIDYDSSLILTPLILVVAIVFGLIFFPILTKFL